MFQALCSLLCLAAVGLFGAPPTLSDDGLAALVGKWTGSCKDENGSTDVTGEVCIRGTGANREISLWGGAYRFVDRTNASDETREGTRTFEVVVNRWDTAARTLSFDRHRLIWKPAENLPASDVHRVQWLKLVDEDGMAEEATEDNVRGVTKTTTGFACTLRRLSRTVTRTGPNACPTEDQPR